MCYILEIIIRQEIRFIVKITIFELQILALCLMDLLELLRNNGRISHPCGVVLEIKHKMAYWQHSFHLKDPFDDFMLIFSVLLWCFVFTFSFLCNVLSFS